MELEHMKEISQKYLLWLICAPHSALQPGDILSSLDKKLI